MVEEKVEAVKKEVKEEVKVEKIKEKKTTYKYVILVFSALAILIVFPVAGVFSWTISLSVLGFLALIALAGVVIYLSTRAKAEKLPEVKIASLIAVNKKIEQFMQSDSIADYLIDTKEEGVQTFGSTNTPVFVKLAKTYWSREKVAVIVNMFSLNKIALVKTHIKSEIQKASEKVAEMPLVFGRRYERFLTPEGTTHEISEDLPPTSPKKSKEELE